MNDGRPTTLRGVPHKPGEWRWRFRAANGKIIAVSSEGYKEKRDVENSMLIIGRNSYKSPVEWIE